MNKLNIIYISIILVLFFFGYYFFRLDDTFIFYKYAKNIAEGNGYVFNIGEKVNATTSPLYTLILAFIYWIIKSFFNDSFVIIGNLVSITSILLILYSVKNIFNDNVKFYWFAFVFLAMPLLKFGFGMETHLNLAIIVFSVFLYTKEKYLLAAVFIAFSILARFDSILFAGIIFLHYIIKNKKLPPLPGIIIFVVIVSSWFIFSKLYFDSYLPTTISAKLSQSDLGLFGPGLIFLTNSTRVIPGGYLTVSAILVMVLFSPIYIYLQRINIFKNDGILIIIVWSVTLFITYAFIINAPPYQWYYTPFAIPVAILSAISLSEIIKKDKWQKIVFALLFISACVLPIKNLIQGYNPKYKNFFRAAEWLNNNAPDGSLLAVDDIGILGYYYNKGKLIDALGLINPEVPKHLSQKDFDWFLTHFKPEFIAHEYPKIQLHLRGNEKIFWQNYTAIKIFESRREKIAIYKRHHE
ncbi:MAG TPA: hypothetical protein DHV28_03340 [Ignavibacteriales bacterium]|nr:hypothetical protein [Ignavibacteriales bacterium]